MSLRATGIPHARAGFALVVVLAGLVILTALFATTQARSLAAVTRLATDQALLDRDAEGAALLRLAGAALSADPAVVRVALPAPWSGGLIVQDTGGLVDLNSALPDLLDGLAGSLGLDAAAIERLRDWRRSGLRLQSIADFARLTGLPAAAHDDLPLVATVFSGRPGLDPTLAPAALLAALGPQALPPGMISAPTGSIFAVWHHPPSPAAPRYLGTLDLGTDARVTVLERH